MNRLLREYFFLFSTKLFFKKKSEFLHICPCPSAKAADLSPLGNDSLLCFSAICSLLTHVCHCGPTLQSCLLRSGVSGWPKWMNIGDNIGKWKDCPRALVEMNSHIGFQEDKSLSVMFCCVFCPNIPLSITKKIVPPDTKQASCLSCLCHTAFQVHNLGLWTPKGLAKR